MKFSIKEEIMLKRINDKYSNYYVSSNTLNKDELNVVKSLLDKSAITSYVGCWSGATYYNIKKI